MIANAKISTIEKLTCYNTSKSPEEEAFGREKAGKMGSLFSAAENT